MRQALYQALKQYGNSTASIHERIILLSNAAFQLGTQYVFGLY